MRTKKRRATAKKKMRIGTKATTATQSSGIDSLSGLLLQY